MILNKLGKLLYSRQLSEIRQKTSVSNEILVEDLNHDSWSMNECTSRISLNIRLFQRYDDIHREQVLIPTTFGPLSTSMPKTTKPTPTEHINKEGSQKE